MKKIVLFVSINFVFLFSNISVAQAACTVSSVNYSACLHNYCSPKFVQGWAYATEDNPNDCRASCLTWGTAGTYPADPSYQFHYYEYKRHSDLSVVCSVSTTNNMWPCVDTPPGGVSECNY